MKMYEIVELSNLYNSIKNEKLPLKTAYKFTLIMKKVEAEIQFYQSEFMKIIADYGQKDDKNNFVYLEDGQSIAILPGKEAECNKQLNELKNLEISFDDIKFKISELEQLNLTLAQLNCLIPFIED